MTIDEMIAAIERYVCIRKFWRCNAGWGMFTITRVAAEEHQRETERWYESRMKLGFGPTHEDRCGRVELTRANPPPEPPSTVDRYYPTFEACVRAEYAKICP